jgi:predicted adenine nucleotide alpha hydrolase (AANH) superfamily ATPase
MVRVLLHVCCGPCSTHVIEELGKEYEVTAYFYNPNVYPKKEYEHRLESAKTVASRSGVDFVEGPYDSEAWNEKVKGFEDEPEGGKRCERCFEVRLRKTAEQARGLDAFATTLTTGPRKEEAVINAIGRRIGEEKGVKFLEADWKKKSGFEKSVQLSREMGLYRQGYCGCRFSMSSEIGQ